MIAGVGFCDRSVFTTGFPVKIAGIHDNTTQGSSMAADELGGGMDYDICSVFNRADEVWCAKGVINHKRQTVCMSNFCDCINVRDIAVWVAQRFQVDSFGICLYGGGQFFKVMGIHKGCGDSELRKCVCQQIIAAAIDCLLCYNVIAGLCQSLNGIGDCGSTRCGCQCSSAAFKRGKPLFQYVLR